MFKIFVFFGSPMAAVLSMQEEFSRSLFNAHTPAALPQWTRCFLVGSCSLFRRGMHTQPSHQATWLLGTSKTFIRFFSVKDIYLVREVNHGR
jgi:hypothetical protein